METLFSVIDDIALFPSYIWGHKPIEFYILILSYIGYPLAYCFPMSGASRDPDGVSKFFGVIIVFMAFPISVPLLIVINGCYLLLISLKKIIISG